VLWNEKYAKKVPWNVYVKKQNVSNTAIQQSSLIMKSTVFSLKYCTVQTVTTIGYSLEWVILNYYQHNG
jgi:hypothetical protein